MTDERRPAKSGQKTGEKPRPKKLSKSDTACLDAFCAQIPLDEISLDSWQSSFADLDLRVPLWLSKETALKGGELPVSFCRSVRQTAADRPARTPVQCLVPVPTNCKNGRELRVQGQGDQLAERFGDLIVTVHVKS